MRRGLSWALVALVLLGAIGAGLYYGFARPDSPADAQRREYARLPDEAKETIRRIDRGGPFPYRRDGVTFANREGRLPRKQRGYYREYTVKTPGSRSRGARRIVSGRGGEMYYSADHYRSFVRVR
ncbi:MAG: hypothetical protein KC609_04305 [Myxococcales bacterium]|nr:hypothetical protein [Myxococcales bacterium]